jgi:[acyl-carrier-protein] S-malonyltransferase
MESLLDRGCDLFIELGPGGVLAGLLQRTRKGVNAVSVNDAETVQICAETLRAVG